MPVSTLYHTTQSEKLWKDFELASQTFRCLIISRHALLGLWNCPRSTLDFSSWTVDELHRAERGFNAAHQGHIQYFYTVRAISLRTQKAALANRRDECSVLQVHAAILVTLRVLTKCALSFQISEVQLETIYSAYTSKSRLR